MKQIALLLLLAGCLREPSPWEKVGVRVVDGKPQLVEVEIELGRTGCEGFCPEYTVKLRGDGTVTYTGKSHVKMNGEHTGYLAPNQLLPLLERFQELDFLATRHECSTRVDDNSHANLALRIGARSSAASDEVVGFERLLVGLPADDALWHRRMFALENAIDAAVDIESWIGTAAERR